VAVPPVEQEFVAHLFAPLDGPAAAAALGQLRNLWDNCRTQLGMTRPIIEADLPGEMPAEPAAAPEQALAGIQDPEINFQAVVRREHDVLNFSLVMATPVDPPTRRRFGLGAVVPPGWHEFHRWWQRLTSAGTGALLGSAVIYQAKARRPAEANVRGTLPVRDDDGAGWWHRVGDLDGFALWEATAGGDRPDRRLVVVSRPDEDARLSRLTWSAGGTALPPLGRYLMHAAKVRYHARVLGDGHVLSGVRDRLDQRLDRLTDLLQDPDGVAYGALDAAGLAADESALVASIGAVTRMRHSVDIARTNMASVLTDGPLPADGPLAAWLGQELADKAVELGTTRERAERLREIVGQRWPPADPGWRIQPDGTRVRRPHPVAEDPFAGAGWAETPPRDATARVEQRLAFGVDVVSYSRRTVPQQHAVQARLAGVADRVLQRVGLDLRDTDRQDAGDGMMVVLPADLEAHRALPELLHGWHELTTADNTAHPDDRIRLRLSVVTGPFARAAIGFSGNTIIEAGRLLDSAELRAAAVTNPSADLVAIISERLHEDVVAAGYAGLSPSHFIERLVTIKSKGYRKRAWLWTAGAQQPAADREPDPEPDREQERERQPEPESEPEPDRPSAVAGELAAEPVAVRQSGREVFLIHGMDEQARDAVARLLRAVDLRPLDWEELISRTGDPAPYAGRVLEQAFADNQAAIVLFTPDDTRPAGDGRPNVLFRAGMAMALQPDRTIVVELGDVQSIGDLAGRQVVRLTADPGSQRRGQSQIIQLLRVAGCELSTDGVEWFSDDYLGGLDAYEN
jgi:hypothetical protein